MISYLDTDLYKLTMQQAVRRCFPRAAVRYRLFDRSETRFPPEFADWIRKEIRQWRHSVALAPAELHWLRGTGYFRDEFLWMLADSRMDPGEVRVEVDPTGALDLEITGTWQATILWEVPLLALINHLYFDRVETGWKSGASLEDHYQVCRQEAEKLIAAKCRFADFGTRRRQSPAHQEAAVRAFRDAARSASTPEGQNAFLGTSNMHFARLFEIAPIGTTAHEWVMAHSIFSGLGTANRDALLRWMQIYGDLATTAITDTYTSPLFFDNFERVLAEGYTSLRHDSGDPFLFIDQVLDFYQALGLDARKVTLVFSDQIDSQRAVELSDHLAGRAQAVFGLGTDRKGAGVIAPDLAIKLAAVNGQAVCKLGDDRQKATGPSELVRTTAALVEARTRTSPHYVD